MTRLHLIRHGRATALEADYDQLHAHGELQARQLGEHLAARGQRFDAIYVGPLRRQLETLRLMREAAGEVAGGWPQPVVLDGLAEGPFEPLMKQHVRPRLPHDAALEALALRVREAAGKPDVRDRALNELFDYMIELWGRGEISSPELEPPAAFAGRVEQALVEIVEREGPGREIAVVSSNGVIGHLLERAGQAPPAGATRHRLYNSSVSLLELSAGRSVVHAYNQVEHIRDREHLTVL